MLILELGIWLIPFTLLLAPCRRFVLLVAKLQQLHTIITRPFSSSPNIWNRMTGLNYITFTI
ncbi:hypothetical protein MA16_Dca027584 [Dendrobium catenatum]|uniref:Uncharacterized protein n=1 Tax=Dendrobium catenatum TaxID=906689 RepID=A0A2I0X1H9_9ASPA|nr:hypothetical protein MA16_Dca004675 [Dendrobium catenatum]PKU81778.1 hypothetical protein MA16_Dca027584 [Dendrobium catenatum]